MRKLDLSLISISILLASCGGGGGGSTPTQLTGVFLDAPVQGAGYVSSPSGIKGTTDALGQFNYVEGDTLTFSLGDIILGSGIPDAKKQVKITQLPFPYLVAQLLQSLDTNAEEDKINVSNLNIEKTLVDKINTRLKQGSGSSNSLSNILTSEEFNSIKSINSSIIKESVVSFSDANKHVDTQLGSDFIKISDSDISKKHFIRRSAPYNSNPAGILEIIRFNDNDRNLRLINIRTDTSTNEIHYFAKYTKLPWSINEGILSYGNCTAKAYEYINNSIKLIENCNGKYNSISFDETQPLTEQMLTNKILSIENIDGGNNLISFESNRYRFKQGSNNYGEYLNFALHGSFTDTIWLDQSNIDGNLSASNLILTDGDFDKGKFVFISYDENNKFESLVVYDVNKYTGKLLLQADMDPS